MRAVSPFSHSSLATVSQASSLSGLANISRAGTGPPRVQSPRRHSSLAHMIQSTSAFGQHVAACRSSAVGPRRAVLVRCCRGPYVWSWRCQQLADPVSVGESSQLHGRPRPPLAPAVSLRFDQRAAKHHSPNMIATASGTGALVVTFMKAAVLDVYKLVKTPKLDRSNFYRFRSLASCQCSTRGRACVSGS